MPTVLSSARAATSMAPEMPAMMFATPAENRPLTLADHLRTLQRYSARLHFARNEALFDEADPADQVYKIVSGVVRICRHTSDGRRHITDFLLPGDLIGFLETPDQPATAEAVSPVTTIAYPRNRIDALADADPSIRARILCHLSSHLLETQRQLFVLGCQNAKERLASFLLRLADRLDVMQGDRLELPMGRQDIADHLGLTIETVSRAITTLKTQGYIVVPNTHQLILSNVPALRALALEV